MTLYKQPASPYYYYYFYFEGRRYQASSHLRNKTIAYRVECIKKAELAQRRRGQTAARISSASVGLATGTSFRRTTSCAWAIGSDIYKFFGNTISVWNASSGCSSCMGCSGTSRRSQNEESF